MQSENDLFKRIKKSPDLNPRDEFVIEAKRNLLQKARKLHYKKKFKGFSLYFVSIASFITFVILGLNVISNDNSQNFSGANNDSKVVNVGDEETLQEEDIIISVFREESEQVEEVPLEKYIIGVVAAEMDPTFEIEALKAQALLARTYIIRHILNSGVISLPEDAMVTDAIFHQIYRNQEELKTIWGTDFEMYMKKVEEAVLSTQGQILTFNNEPIQAAFFSTSNGYTENPEDYWGIKAPYLKSVESSWDQSSPRFRSSKTISIEEFEKALGIVLPGDGSIGEISERTESGRVAKVVIEGKEFSGRHIREKLELESSDFNWEQQGEQITIETKGYGHGVGMSQDGANGMALEGKNYKEIVNHYYSGIEIEKVNNFLTQILPLIE
ncbi:stage II sporulation protein D [Halalkalibacter akibai]|uniref:Stage II sporulation protein D n=1 Tax=Halalkalibacter akibai (strain ATCC 43226 / DSM 21942 / CIP 109018 / JCM 9157 / 1139) TaxID=1236973 RepID=W4QZQ6_HALA3|nr:stage II sporulation protein D [Halalkalibacter akibai]GAE37556.1 stage II sporulation protein D [Halalkalibacter akibai JCM 9157]